MEALTDKIILNKENNRDYNNLPTEHLTYKKKIQNEINSIPKTYEKFFKKALNKHSFDTEIYIPHSTEANRKIHPNKNYLLNKIILYENSVSQNKELRDIMSKESTKFSKFYHIAKDRDNSQKIYIEKLLSYYRNLGYNMKNLKYKRKDNIFNNSILLDQTFGNNTNDDVLKFGNNEQNRRNFYIDNMLLLKFNDVLHKTKFSKAMTMNDRDKMNNFNLTMNNSINDFIKGSKINSNINNIEIVQKKAKSKKEKNKKNKTDNNQKKEEITDNSEASPDKNSVINENGEELFVLNEGKKNSVAHETSQSNDKSLFKKSGFYNYVKSSRLSKFSNNSRNKEEEYNKTSFKSNKNNNNTLTTDFDNNSIINENKTNELTANNNQTKSIQINIQKDNQNENTFNLNKINVNTINGFRNSERKKTKNSKKGIDKYYLSSYNKFKKNQYLLTSLNRVKISKKKDENNSNIDNNNKSTISEKDIKNNSNSINETQLKENLKINLPEIHQKEASKRKISLTDNKEEKVKNEFKKIILNKTIKDNKADKDKSKNKKSKEKNKSVIEKMRQQEINDLYSSVKLNQYFFSDYPFDKIKNYFSNYTKLKIPKININNGSNLHSMIDGLENIVKKRDHYSLVKSVNETKREMHLKTSGTFESFRKMEKYDLDKIKEKDDKIPSLKYDYAYTILCVNKKCIGNLDNPD